MFRTVPLSTSRSFHCKHSIGIRHTDTNFDRHGGIHLHGMTVSKLHDVFVLRNDLAELRPTVFHGLSIFSRPSGCWRKSAASLTAFRILLAWKSVSVHNKRRLFQCMTMSLGAGRLDDMRRRSSVTKLETSAANNNISSLDGADRHPGRYAVCSMQYAVWHQDSTELLSSVYRLTWLGSGSFCACYAWTVWFWSAQLWRL